MIHFHKAYVIRAGIETQLTQRSGVQRLGCFL
jgi:hypothetical protein